MTLQSIKIQIFKRYIYERVTLLFRFDPSPYVTLCYLFGQPFPHRRLAYFLNGTKDTPPKTLEISSPSPQKNVSLTPYSIQTLDLAFKRTKLEIRNLINMYVNLILPQQCSRIMVAHCPGTAGKKRLSFSKKLERHLCSNFNIAYI